MQYLAAYTLASLTGNEPSKDQLSNILKATGQKFDEAEVTKVIDTLKGKKLEDLIKAGSGKVGSVGGSAPAGKPAATTPAPKKQQPKKEAKKEEPKAEEEDDFGAGDLFG